jgi:sortase A
MAQTILKRIRFDLALFTGGTLLLGYWLAAVADSQWFDQRQKAALEGYARERTAASAGERTADGSGKLVGRVDLPRVGVSAVIVDSLDERSLRRAVGLVPGTAWPGARGHAVVAGHRDLHFRGLRKIRIGDQITIRTPGESVRYEVTATRVVGPSAIEVLEPTEGVDLTLLTCYPFGFIGPAPQRFIAQARRVSAERREMVSVWPHSAS